MIQQTLYLTDYGNWEARIYYAEAECYCAAMLEDLERIGCPRRDLERIEGLLRRCRRNTGFTYTSREHHFSVVFIAPTDSAAEFNDTYDHEKGHLAKHIARALGIDPWGEDYQYLAGEIAYQTFPYASRFLCEHCRRLHKSKESSIFAV
jgi:hypothetical protein